MQMSFNPNMTEDYYYSQLSDEEIEAQSMKGLTSADEVSQIRVLQLADQSQLQESPKAKEKLRVAEETEARRAGRREQTACGKGLRMQGMGHEEPTLR